MLVTVVVEVEVEGVGVGAPPHVRIVGLVASDVAQSDAGSALALGSDGLGRSNQKGSTTDAVELILC